VNRLAGKTALITGGARGQGRAIAQKFASEGADIAVCDIAAPIASLHYELATEDDLYETAALVEAEGRTCVAEVADVRDQAALDRLVRRTIDELGKIDILVAQAAIVNHAQLWEISEEEWRDVVDVTLTGAWHSLKAVAPHMIERGSGSVVFTSSLNGIEGGANYAHYIAAKHGVCGLMKSAALELGPHNVRVNAVLPGPVDTPVIDNPSGHDRIAGKEGATREEYLASIRHWYLLRGRTALPARAIADAMIWLVSDEAKHVAGIELVIDAGHNVLPGLNPAPIEDWAAYDEETITPSATR
jgi:SDR family mycofactocin-dependent oxidoreductase